MNFYNLEDDKAEVINWLSLTHDILENLLNKSTFQLISNVKIIKNIKR